MGFIGIDGVLRLARTMSNTEYGRYLEQLIEEERVKV
jgi:hypothetical protein